MHVVRGVHGAHVVRPATRSDTAGICRLLGAAFPDNPKADPEVYAWQYWDNPFGAPASWVCERDGEIVGHAGLFRCPGSLAGRPLILGHASDAAIATAHRGQGLFGELAERRYTGALERGIAATLTLPNARSRAANERAGLVIAGRVQAFIRPLTPPWWPRASGGGGWKELPGPPPGLDELEQRDLQAGDGVRRGADWWRWRYARRPSARYRFFAIRGDGRLVAAVVTSVRRIRGVTFVQVMDLLADGHDSARRILAAASDAGTEQGARAAVLLALPGGPTALLARRCGYRRLPTLLEPQPMLLGVLAAPSLSAVVSRARWRVSWGDHDHL